MDETMGREPSNAPEQNGEPAARDIDTFRPAADADAYSAETVVKAIPRELLADLAAALKAPGVPRVDVAPRPGKAAPAADAKPATPTIEDELTPIGDDDATVIDRFDPLAVEEIPPMPSSGRGAPPPELTPLPPPPGDDDEDDDVPPLGRVLPLARAAAVEVSPSAVAPQAGTSSASVALAPAPPATDLIDENTDFRAGTRWPWITALVLVVISFVVTLAILKAF